MTPLKFHLLLIAKLPIAWLAGLRLKEYTAEKCSIFVRLSFLNQNPFKSMFWAVQGMAAELTSGLICIDKIRKSRKHISMLVIEQKAFFYKKAVGKIVFTCNQGNEIQSAIDSAIQTGEVQQIQVVSEGLDEAGNTVSRFEFVWSLKLK